MDSNIFNLSNNIENILTANFDIEQAAQTLVDQAKENGGHDNITIILIIRK